MMYCTSFETTVETTQTAVWGSFSLFASYSGTLLNLTMRIAAYSLHKIHTDKKVVRVHNNITNSHFDNCYCNIKVA